MTESTWPNEYLHANGAQGWWKSPARPVLSLFGKVSHILHPGIDVTDKSGNFDVEDCLALNQGTKETGNIDMLI